MSPSPLYATPTAIEARVSVADAGMACGLVPDSANPMPYLCSLTAPPAPTGVRRRSYDRSPWELGSLGRRCGRRSPAGFTTPLEPLVLTATLLLIPVLILQADATPEGRIIGIVVMVMGVAFVSLLTATIAARFIRTDESGTDELRETLARVESELAEIKALLADAPIRTKGYVRQSLLRFARACSVAEVRIEATAPACSELGARRSGGDGADGGWWRSLPI